MREEVLTPFAGKLAERADEKARTMGTDKAEASVFRDLSEALGLIEHEAEAHGFFDEATLAKAFGRDPATLTKVKANGERWLGLRRTLKVAVEKRDVNSAEHILEEMRVLNWEFSIAAAERPRQWLDELATPKVADADNVTRLPRLSADLA